MKTAFEIARDIVATRINLVNNNFEIRYTTPNAWSRNMNELRGMILILVNIKPEEEDENAYYLEDHGDHLEFGFYDPCGRWNRIA